MPNAQVPAALFSTIAPCERNVRSAWPKGASTAATISATLSGFGCASRPTSRSQTARFVSSSKGVNFSERVQIDRRAARCPVGLAPERVNDCRECAIRIGVSIWEKGAIHPRATGKPCIIHRLK